MIDTLSNFETVTMVGHRGPGIRRVSWAGRATEGGRVASGVYFVRLAPASSNPIVKKIVVLR